MSRQHTRVRSGRGSSKQTPAAPTGLTATPTGQTTIHLDWATPYSGTVKTVALSGWKVYRSETSGSGFSLRSTVTVSEYDDTAVVGTRYYYKVTAVGLDAESAYSTEVSAITQGDYQAPAWTIPDLVGIDANLGNVTKGGYVDLTSYYSVNDGTPVFSIQSITAAGGSDTSGITIDSATGRISVSETTPADSYTVSVLIGSPQTEITTLGISGAGAWTFGQAFKQGDALNYVAVAGGQAEVRNRWADGSVKFAVLSGIASAAGSVSITTSASDTMSGTAVAEPTLAETSVDFGAYGKATLTRTAQGSWNKATAGRVRSIPGPVMSEFHYYAPAPSDAHLAVWWYVRAYSNGQIEVETVVENGWLRVTSPGSRSYTPTMRVNGSTVYAPGAAITHHHHTRWSRVDWASGTAVTPTHSSSYLKSTRLLLNPSVSSITWASRVSTENLTPFDRGDYYESIGDAGSRGSWLESWDIAYIAAPTAARWATLCGNARAHGRWLCHYRDELTGNLVLANAVSPLGVNPTNAGIGISAPAQTTPLPTDQPVGQQYSWSHSPPAPYAHYLLSGRWSSMEEVVSLGMWVWLTNSESARASGVVGQTQTRAQAWAHRTLAQAWAVAPDNEASFPAYRTDLKTVLERQVDLFYGRTQSATWANDLGVLWADWTFDTAQAEENAWEFDYLSYAYLATGELDVPWTTASKYTTVRARMGQYTIMRAGEPTGWYWRAHNSRIKCGTGAPGQYSPPTTWYTVAQSYDLTNAVKPATNPTGPIYYGDGSGQTDFTAVVATAYFTPWLTALALAKDAGLAGAAEGLARVRAASNYTSNIVNTWPAYPADQSVDR